MKYGALFAVLGLAWLAVGVVAGTPVALAIAAYCSLSFLGVGAAYWGLGPRVFGKSSGRLPWWSYALFGPYHVLQTLTFQLFRRFSREDRFNEVVPGLYLGRRLTHAEVGLEGCPDFGAVLDLTSEFTEPAPLRGLPTTSVSRSWMGVLRPWIRSESV